VDRPLLVPPYTNIEAAVNASGAVPPGYRIYFVTLEIPNTPQAFSESYGNNLNEWGDNNSGTAEPGLFTQSVVATNPLSDLPVGQPFPSYTLVDSTTGIGQSTSANWNGAFRLMNLPNVDANAELDSGSGRLKATFNPHLGDGQDGVLDTTISPFGPGADTVTLSTDAVPGASINGDAVYEFERVRIGPNDTLFAAGQNPLVILCRGDFVIEGTVELSGADGGPGLDTDGSTLYQNPQNPGSAPSFGFAGLAGPGGGRGGRGGDAFTGQNTGLGETGLGPRRLEVRGNTPEGFEAFPSIAGGLGGVASDGSNPGGGGGGFGTPGAGGADAAGSVALNGGASFGDDTFRRALSDFQPDRGYYPNALISGGTGGGGGGVEDDNAGSETGNGSRDNGDDGGGGGGGGAGAMWAIAGGQITVSGTLRANGGRGGSTYDQANQQLSIGPDGQPMTSDDVIVGIIPGAIPSGQGGPGAGGSGGGFLLVSRGNMTVSGVVSVVGGAGGASGDPDRVGGAGGDGRVVLMTMAGGGTIDTTGATVNGGPAQTSQGGWSPTVVGASAGQSVWFDLSTPTAQFQTPFFTTNFAFLQSQGLIQGVDFNAVLEFQGADTLVPAPGGATPPTTATGLTQWSTNETSVNLKRYVRVRWRFMVANNFPSATSPMPAILDHTIPFSR
jgi:hypothetical protein